MQMATWHYSNFVKQRLRRLPFWKSTYILNGPLRTPGSTLKNLRQKSLCVTQIWHIAIFLSTGKKYDSTSAFCRNFFVLPFLCAFYKEIGVFACILLLFNKRAPLRLLEGKDIRTTVCNETKFPRFSPLETRWIKARKFRIVIKIVYLQVLLKFFKRCDLYLINRASAPQRETLCSEGR